jgi:uncharacterized protein YhaN
MKLNRLGLNDFGIYQNENLRNLDDGINIIAGPQRAGKTTFMKAVRHLPFGITKGDDVPPPSNQYDLFAEAQREEQELEIRLNGYAVPEASSDSVQINLEDITGQIDKTKYRQLFTISLDQLKKLPDGIENKKQLSEVLLGAAFGKIAEIPDIKEEFDDKADNIGLSRGDPNATTTDLNEPYNKIEKGVKSKEEALKQVDKYKTKKEKLEKVKQDINEAKNKISGLNDEKSRLGLIQENFDDIIRLQELEDKLNKEDIEKSNSFPIDEVSKMNELKNDLRDLSGTTEVVEEFKNKVDVGGEDEYREQLLENEKEIRNLKEQVSGWETELKGIQQDKEEIDDKEDQIKQDIGQIGPDYQSSLSEIKEIDTDILTKEEVSQAVQDLQEAISKKEGHEEELRGIRSQLDGVEQKLENKDEKELQVDKIDVIKQLSIISGVPFAALAGLSIVGYPIPGIIVSTLILSVLIYWKSDDLIPEISPNDRVDELKSKKNSLETQETREKEQKDSARDEVKEARDRVEDLIEELDLKDVEETKELEAVYTQIVDLSEQIKNLEKERSKLHESEKELNQKLQGAAAKISRIKNLSLDKDLEKNLNKIKNKLEALEEEIEAAKKVRKELIKKDQVKKQINDLLLRTDLIPKVDVEKDKDQEIISRATKFVKLGEELDQVSENSSELEEIKQRLKSKFNRKRNVELFEGLKDEDQSWIDVLIERANEFADEDEIENKIEEIENKKQQIDNEKPENREISDLKSDLEDLSSDKDIMEAQEKIEEGQKELQSLGEEYAVNRFAEKMADRLNQKFIEDIAGSLIEEAGEIFSQVTEDYKDLDHNNQIENLEFEALKENDSQHVEELSRATKEQLFMSLRIARIKQLDAKLPIIIDDSMTNFDPEHTARMLQIIETVAEENQVIILTCHPELIDIAEDNTEVSQYIGLKEGHFEGDKTSQEVKKLLEA